MRPCTEDFITFYFSLRHLQKEIVPYMFNHFFYRNTKGLIFLVLNCEQKKRLQKNKGGNKQERIKTDMIHRNNL